MQADELNRLRNVLDKGQTMNQFSVHRALLSDGSNSFTETN